MAEDCKSGGTKRHVIGCSGERYTETGTPVLIGHNGADIPGKFTPFFFSVPGMVTPLLWCAGYGYALLALASP